MNTKHTQRIFNSRVCTENSLQLIYITHTHTLSRVLHLGTKPLGNASTLIQSIDGNSSTLCSSLTNSGSSSASTSAAIALRWKRDVCVDNDHFVLNDFLHTIHRNETRLPECFDSVCRLSAAFEVNFRVHTWQTRLTSDSDERRVASSSSLVGL